MYDDVNLTPTCITNVVYLSGLQAIFVVISGRAPLLGLKAVFGIRQSLA